APPSTLFPYTTLFRSDLSRLPPRRGGEGPRQPVPGRPQGRRLPPVLRAARTRQVDPAERPEADQPVEPHGSVRRPLEEEPAGDRSEEHTSELQSRENL